MPVQSAGLLLHRTRDASLEVFLVHPAGPFWAKKDAAAWSMPKGEFRADEDPLVAAQREFTEETGFVAAGPFRSLGTLKQAGGKIIHAFTATAEFDAAKVVSNRFTLEWPPRSGRTTEFPEIDRAAWISLELAAVKIHRGQLEFLMRLRNALHA